MKFWKFEKSYQGVPNRNETFSIRNPHQHGIRNEEHCCDWARCENRWNYITFRLKFKISSVQYPLSFPLSSSPNCFSPPPSPPPFPLHCLESGWVAWARCENRWNYINFRLQKIVKTLTFIFPPPFSPFFFSCNSFLVKFDLLLAKECESRFL